MGLAPEGEPPVESLAEITTEMDAADATIPEALQVREAGARTEAIETVEAEAPAEPSAEPGAAPEREQPVPAEEPTPAAESAPAEEPAPAAVDSGIPEALLRRSAEAKAKATGRPVEEVLAEMKGGVPPVAEPAPVEPGPVEEPTPAAESAPAEEPAPAAVDSGIPEALLRRSAEAKAKATGRPVEEVLAEMTGGAEPPGVAEPVTSPVVPQATPKTPAAVEAPAATAEAAESIPATMEGRTTTITAPPVVAPPGTPENVRPQRLLTVVRAKSIQQVKAEPTDKVSVWPHLLLIEFVALLGVTALLVVLSVILQAPLLELANFNATPNPSKAPWYFLGLQELLSYFDPQIAGVLIPGLVGLIGLMAVPYVDRNPSTKPSDRKFAIMFFTIFLVASATLTMLGVLFRGPGFNFSYPWSDGIWFDDLKDWIFFE
jgi:hypothetical protein